MKIEANRALTNFDGKPLQNGAEEFKVGHALANILVSAQANGKMKMFVLAKRFYDEKSVELDDADLSLVKKLVEETAVYNTLVTGQILLLLEK